MLSPLPSAAIFATLPSTDPVLQLHACFITPSSPLLAVAFITPSAFLSLLLLLTLYATWNHRAAERALGHSFASVLRRDQALYLLAICLVSLVNVGLVFQTTKKAYRLIGWLPSMCLTQILLRQVVFNTRRQVRQEEASRGLVRYESSMLREGSGSSGRLPKSPTSAMALMGSHGRPRLEPVAVAPSFLSATRRELSRIGHEVASLEHKSVQLEEEVARCVDRLEIVTPREVVAFPMVDGSGAVTPGWAGGRDPDGRGGRSPGEVSFVTTPLGQVFEFGGCRRR